MASLESALNRAGSCWRRWQIPYDLFRPFKGCYVDHPRIPKGKIKKSKKRK